jgi:peptidoglycan/xylan/chitin deacetylase (PgdA/CDA1 family)
MKTIFIGCVFNTRMSSLLRHCFVILSSYLSITIGFTISSAFAASANQTESIPQKTSNKQNEAKTSTHPTGLPQAIILQYHHVSTHTARSTSLSPEEFAAHLNWLDANQYTVWPLPKVLHAIEQNTHIPNNTVAITFDDGYIDVYENAFPLLKAKNWPFTLFVNTEPLGHKAKGHASWPQLKEMAESGATIANHTNSHAFLVRQDKDESTQQWLNRVADDITRAEEDIYRHTGQSHKLLAYPYGETNLAIMELMESLGYRSFGQQSGPLSQYSDKQLMPRFALSGAYSGMSGFAEKMRSLALPVEMVSSDLPEEVMSYDAPAPTLRFSVKKGLFHPSRLTCYASEQGQAETAYQALSEAYSFEVKAKAPLKVGRSRYNCTAPSKLKGRYFWFSYSWLKRGENNQWIHQ